ncbi:MAG: cell division protein FtsA [Clostridiaceae bacterium]|nr:cell division protein FtsA [Clostridiaceae bacterium]
MLLNEGLTSLPEDAVFALDIGTRTIIGVVGVQKDEQFIVHAVEIYVHNGRAMMDGQIHDINKVVQGIKKVKEALEKKLGVKLTRAAIAAAGRVLRTCRVMVERKLEEGREIDSQFIGALEMEGIHKAQLQIDSSLSENEKDQFYCVGYSVINYYLNDYVISSLSGHKGNTAAVDMMATFLPQTVVDSLYTVMERSGLEVAYLTLEPIAALNIAIPKELRLLNLALVDIGAGTSDIAITKSGTVVAYAMVPVAGDEVTEAIAQHYLVDFNTAEKIKLSINDSGKPITFTDILDNQVSVSSDEVNTVIHPVVEQLASTIAEKVLEYNGGKAPNAIFLVGGGSQVQGLCEAVSRFVGLPKERVAVRNRSIAKNVIADEGVLNGPDSITPLGILVTAAMAKEQDFFYVTVNGSKVRMYNSRKMTVADALILAGISSEQLIGRSGKTLRFSLNNRETTIRGELGEPAEIYVNNERSRLNENIQPGDEIKVIPAKKGQDGSITASAIQKEYQPVYFTYNDHTETIYPQVIINGVQALPDTSIQEGDRVEVIMEYTLDEISRLYEMDLSAWEFTINGMPCEKNTRVMPGDHVRAMSKALSGNGGKNEPALDENTKELIKDEKSKDESVKEENVQTQEEKINEPDNSSLNDTPVRENAQRPGNDTDIKALLTDIHQKLAERDGITVTINGKAVNMPPKSNGYMFVDVFNYIDFDLSSPKGSIVLMLNGKSGNFTDKIKTGDIIEIFWKE